jgi:ribosomal protein S18 acetylase RimI-like enzyme
VPSSGELRIRTAVARDLRELQRVFVAASLSNEGDAPSLLASPEFLDFAGDGIDEGRTRVVCETPDDRRVLGFATIVPDGHGEPELEDLFVDPAHRRRGIARRLVRDAAATARAAGHRRLLVTANPHAQDFYDAVGFVEIGRVDTELGSGARMQLPIAVVDDS